MTNPPRRRWERDDWIVLAVLLVLLAVVVVLGWTDPPASWGDRGVRFR